MVRSRRFPGVGLWGLSFGLLLVALPACARHPAVLRESPLTERVLRGIASGKGTFAHDELDAILRAHVTADGNVDYKAIAAARAPLDRYLERLASADLASLSRNELLALLVNAYNAYTLDLIVRHLPVTSIREIKDVPEPWKLEFCRVGGETCSLDFIEHNLLRPKETFDDPRIHFAVNCASKGCPPLRAAAYTGAGIEKELDAAVTACLRDPRHFRVMKSGDVKVNMVLKWFASDFERRHGSVSKFLIPYLEGEAAPPKGDVAARWLRDRGDSALSYLDYDWSLNGK